MITFLFPLIQLEKQAKTTFCLHICPRTHGFGCKSHEVAPRVVSSVGSHEAVDCVQILLFFVLFWAFSRLGMSCNLGWIYPNLYCLLKPSKNHWNSFFVSVDLSCSVLFFRITWFNSKKTQNIYEVAWFGIKVNYFLRLWTTKNIT